MQAYADSATKAFEYFSSLYGPPPSLDLNLVELPDDTLPTVWAPEIAGLASRAIQEKVNYRLLANTIAHQWWGVSVSPASMQDAWLTDGFARYAQAAMSRKLPAAQPTTKRSRTCRSARWPTMPSRSPASASSTPSRPSFRASRRTKVQ